MVINTFAIFDTRPMINRQDTPEIKTFLQFTKKRKKKEVRAQKHQGREMLSYVPAGMKGNEDKGRAGAGSWTLYNRERENINSVKLSYHQQLTHLSPHTPHVLKIVSVSFFLSFFPNKRLHSPPPGCSVHRTKNGQCIDAQLRNRRRTISPQTILYTQIRCYIYQVYIVFLFILFCTFVSIGNCRLRRLFISTHSFFFLTFSDCIHILILIPVSLCWVFGSCVRKQHPDVRTLLLYLYAFLFIFYLFSFLLCFWIVSNVFVYALAIHTHFTQQQLLYCVPTHRHCRPYSVVYTI